MRRAMWVAICIAWAGGIAAAAPKTDAGRVAILNADSLWRCHLMWRSVQVKRTSGDLEFMAVRRRRLVPVKEPIATPPPPADWAAVAFDDRGWCRARPPLFARPTQAIALMSLRGKFTVADPAALAGKPLTLTLTYRGGAVVSVNGREIARGHLSRGDVRPETPAEAYPDEAYVAPAGYRLRWVGFGDPEKYKDRFALRNRALTAEVPPAMLRKGANIIAVEVHRAPTSEIYFKSRILDDPRYSTLDLCSVEAVTLTAPRGAGVEPNTAAPAGLRLWNWPAAGQLHTIDYGDPHDAVSPIVIAGTRNGAFSGQVVVGSEQPITGLKAATSALAGPDGATIPAESIRVRYALLEGGAFAFAGSARGRPASAYDVRKGIHRFDTLTDAPPETAPVHPPATGAVQPIWVTVAVPADAAPGTYTGTLTVSAADATVGAVPIRLTVADWALPDPKRFESFVGLVQSPDSLAIYYKAPMWSDRHWTLLDRSFALMGGVGVKDVYILARSKTFNGNEQSMVRWIRKPGGGWDHDFSIVERYVDLAVKHLGKPPVVCVYCWDVDAGSTYFGKPVGDRHAHLIPDPGTPFTVLDPKTGAVSEERSPKWSDPGATAFWKPVFDGIRKILAARGLEKSMMLGLTPDKRPTPDAVKVLAEASGGAPWISHAHPYIRKLFGKPPGYITTVWGSGSIPDPAVKRYYGWQTPHLAAIFPRYKSAACGDGLRNNSPPLNYRTAVERALVSSSGLRGIGRCGADFLPVLKGDRRRRVKHTQSILGRYEASSHWHGGWIWYGFDHILAPGPDSPVATVRYEMFREGVQEAETRIFLEKILADPARRATLGADLAARCQRVLDERVRDTNRAMSNAGGGLPFRWYVSAGLTPRTAALYAAAADARAAEKAGPGAQ